MLLPLQLNGLNLDSATPVAVVTANLTESGIIAGGDTIVITLTNDTWVTAGATFDAQRQNILDNITGTTFISSQAVGTVARTSDTVVTITLTAVSGYSISADETGTVTVPATALTGGGALNAGTFTVDDNVGGKKGGRAKRGRRRYYVVEVDGQDFIVTSQAEVRGLLQQAKALAEQSALTEAEKPKSERKVPRIRVRTGSGNKTSSIAIQREIRDTRAEIERIYSDAARKVAEIRKVAERTQQALQDEEDAIIALLM